MIGVDWGTSSFRAWRFGAGGEVLAEVRGDLAPGAVVVSVAAGVSLAALARALPASVAVVRAMPNT
ncbi:MAG: hypothetical protein ACP5NI_09930, partial [Acetobacteraceae bacterium]